MDDLRQYLYSILAASIICAIVIKISGKLEMSAKMIKLVAAVFLSITVIAPVMNVNIADVVNDLDLTDQNGTRIAEQASYEALQETIVIIKDRTKAYIERKADAYGADIDATILISEPTSLTPDGITIKGNVSPYIKTILSNIISEDLGIPEEKQIWN